MPTLVRDNTNTININTPYNELNTKANKLSNDLVTFTETNVNAKIGEVNTKITELMSVNPDGSYYTKDAIDITDTAMTQAEFDAIAQANRDRYAGSGFVEWGKHLSHSDHQLVREGLYSYTAGANFLVLGRDAVGAEGSSKTSSAQVNVNGRLLSLSYTRSGLNNAIITLPPASDDHALPNRYDLVFVEVWDELISEKDFVFPYGNVQSGLTTYQAIAAVDYGTASYSRFGDWDTSPTAGKGMVWSTLSKANKQTMLKDPANNIRLTPDGLVQTRYRVRVVRGPVAGEPLNTALAGDFRYDASNYIKAQGKQVSITQDTNGAYSDDTGFYAPYYRAEFGYEIGAFGALNSAGNGKDFNTSYNGECFAVPVALVSRRNQGAFHPQFNPNGSARFLDTDTTTESMWYATDQTITSTADCFTHASGGALADEAGSNGRPDGLYYDVVYAQDVQDLRYSAHKLELSSEQVNRAFQDDISGFRRGFESSPSVLTDGTISYPTVKAETMLYCDIIGDSAEYPASWATTPVLGHRLITDEAGASYVPNGSRTVYKLKRKAEASPFLVLKGSAVMAVTADWTFSTATNAITFVVAPSATDVIQVFYATQANPYLASNLYPVKGLGDAYSENDLGRRLVAFLTGKIAVGSGAPSVRSLGAVNGHDIVPGTGLLTAAEYKPTHSATVSFGTTASPAVKVLPYLTTISGIAHLVLIFKELIHDTDWGDDQKFVVANGFTTTTDDNANTVACGQASVELPYFVRA